MKLHLIDAAEGDCLLLEDDGTPRRLALIDGGPRGIFGKRLAPYLARVLAPGDGLETVMVSHVDADHITGVLDLLADVERARVDGESALAIADVWHNSFAATIDDAQGTLQRDLQSMMMAAGRARFAAAQAGVGVLGIKQGISVRRLAIKLGIPLNGFFGGAAITQEAQAGTTWQFGATAFSVVGPTAANLAALRKEWRAWVDAHLADFELGDRDAMAAADRSVPNLSSIVLFGETAQGPILLTGDARGDHILEGLEQSGKLDSDGICPLRLLKLQHHGSIRNIDRDFLERLPADIYAISANGKHDNPDLETLLLLVDVAREQGRNPLIVLTNEAPSVQALRMRRPPAEFGYRLAIRSESDEAIVIDLALEPIRNPSR